MLNLDIIKFQKNVNLYLFHERSKKFAYIIKFENWMWKLDKISSIDEEFYTK